MSALRCWFWAKISLVVSLKNSSVGGLIGFACVPPYRNGFFYSAAHLLGFHDCLFQNSSNRYLRGS